MYEWLLFGHLLGVGLLVLGTGIFLTGTEGLRRARSIHELHAWMALAHRGITVLAPGGVMLLGFGVTLAARSWSFTQPWIATSLVLVGLLGANGLRSERWLASVDAAARSATSGLPPSHRSPAHHGANRATLAVLAELEFLMTVKPSSGALLASLLVTAAGAVLLTLSPSVKQAENRAD